MYRFFFAYRFLRSRKINLLCVLGITLGVMTMVVVVSVMKGFSREFRERIRGLLSHIVVECQLVDGIENPDVLLAEIRSLDHVVAAAPRIETLAFIEQGGEITWTWLLGVDPEAEVKVSELDRYVRGSFGFEGGRYDGAIIGAELALLMGAYHGGDMTAYCLGKEGAAKYQFTVVDEFRSGMYEYDSRQMYASLKAVQKMTALGDAVSSISVRVDDYEKNSQEVKSQIWRLIEDRGYVSVMTWEERRQNLLRAVDLEKNVMAVILAFIIIVAAFSITGTLSMMVVQKTRQIGILRSMGSTSSGITAVFLIQGFLMGIVGAGLGVASGLAFVSRVNWISDQVFEMTGFRVFPKDIYYLDTIPTDVEPVTIAGTFVITVLLSVLAAAYPAYRASRLDPVEALRYE